MQQAKPDGITPSQTVGPYFAYGLTPNGKYDWNDAFTNNLVTPDTSGERIRIEGQVFDGDGAVVPDCMLEIWQADAQGRFSDPQDKRALPNSSFKGFGRIGTDANGGYAFDTIKPGRCPIPTASRRRRISCSRCSRAACCCINLLADLFRRRGRQRRRSRAGAGAGRPPRDADRDAPAGHGNAVYRFDIHLQGDNETVFFDV